MAAIICWMPVVAPRCTLRPARTGRRRLLEMQLAFDKARAATRINMKSICRAQVLGE